MLACADGILALCCAAGSAGLAWLSVRLQDGASEEQRESLSLLERAQMIMSRGNQDMSVEGKARVEVQRTEHPCVPVLGCGAVS